MALPSDGADGAPAPAVALDESAPAAPVTNGTDAPATGVPAAPALTLPGPPSAIDSIAYSHVEPLLACRASLLRAHRKSTCWLFFSELGVRPAANGGGPETLLACRLCRPAVTDANLWEAVRGGRAGLVRYSSTSGTSAMRTHVKNVHYAESMAVDRAIAMVDDPVAESERGSVAVAAEAAATSAAAAAAERTADATSRALFNGATGVLSSAEPPVASGKRGLDDDDSPAALAESAKRQRMEGKAELQVSIHEMEIALTSMCASLRCLKRRLESL